ncbi:expansin EXLX1 family cellulose-binding protein [Micromonospora sp. NPDC049559]|uniref:expansin EXLX1 family cellulose-binding protein n=1 Tax=Micromonospora sp. NPDC049559 TaxID=3155923 RepID=UPI00341DBC5C
MGTVDPGRRPRRLRRWLVGGGAVVLAAVVGIALAVRSGAAPACAAPPSGTAVRSVEASYYDARGSGGTCSYPGPPADRLYVALGRPGFSGGAACGSYLDVTGPKGTVRVLVMDECAGCANSKIDLSRQAFARIADPAKGIVRVSYRAAVDPPLPGPLTFRMKGGTSRYWFAVQVGAHGNPLRSVEAMAAGGGWRAAKREPDNYWTIASGLGPGPYSIRVTDVYGNQAVATGIRLAPKQLQRSGVRLYGDPAAGSPSPTPSGTAPSPSASAVPSTPPPSAPAVGASASPPACG